MILVRVRQHQPDQVAEFLLEETDVGHYQIDARQMVFVAERHAEIDREQAALMPVAEAIDRQVHADLADAAKWRESQFVRARH